MLINQLYINCSYIRLYFNHIELYRRVELYYSIITLDSLISEPMVVGQTIMCSLLCNPDCTLVCSMYIHMSVLSMAFNHETSWSHYTGEPQNVTLVWLSSIHFWQTCLNFCPNLHTIPAWLIWFWLIWFWFDSTHACKKQKTSHRSIIGNGALSQRYYNQT
jgi:hypothetical protein